MNVEIQHHLGMLKLANKNRLVNLHFEYIFRSSFFAIGGEAENGKKVESAKYIEIETGTEIIAINAIPTPHSSTMAIIIIIIIEENVVNLMTGNIAKFEKKHQNRQHLHLLLYGRCGKS